MKLYILDFLFILSWSKYNYYIIITKFKQLIKMSTLSVDFLRQVDFKDFLTFFRELREETI
jgi:hypothetical protein